jgi:hypothetical protein
MELPIIVADTPVKRPRGLLGHRTPPGWVRACRRARAILEVPCTTPRASLP